MLTFIVLAALSWCLWLMSAEPKTSERLDCGCYDYRELQRDLNAANGAYRINMAANAFYLKEAHTENKILWDRQLDLFHFRNATGMPDDRLLRLWQVNRDEIRHVTEFRRLGIGETA